MSLWCITFICDTKAEKAIVTFLCSASNAFVVCIYVESDLNLYCADSVGLDVCDVHCT